MAPYRTVGGQLLGSHRGKTVHVSVLQTKGSRDEHGVVNLLVRCALVACSGYDVVRDVAAALLGLLGNVEERLQLVADRGRLGHWLSAGHGYLARRQAGQCVAGERWRVVGEGDTRSSRSTGYRSRLLRRVDGFCFLGRFRRGGVTVQPVDVDEHRDGADDEERVERRVHDLAEP